VDFKITWNDQNLADVIAQKHDTHAAYNYGIRFLEADIAKDYQIPFDQTWYSIPVYTREIMIAAKMGKNWLIQLQEEDAMPRRIT
jgi:hypothetical protein